MVRAQSSCRPNATPTMVKHKLGHGEGLMEDDLPLDVWGVRRGLATTMDQCSVGLIDGKTHVSGSLGPRGRCWLLSQTD